jgi:predicted component of type VI protein secretion system
VHVTEGSTSNTRRVRDAGHASHRRERLRRLEEEGGVPPRCRGARGRRADVEPDVEHQSEQQEYMDLEQEQPDVELQYMEEQELEKELMAMDEEMGHVEPQQRRKKKEKVVDPKPLDDYPGGPHETDLQWKYHVHVAMIVNEI